MENKNNNSLSENKINEPTKSSQIDENIINYEDEDYIVLDTEFVNVNLISDVKELQKDVELDFNTKPIKKIAKQKLQEAREKEEENKKEPKPLKPNRGERKKIRVIKRLIAGEINGPKAAQLLKISTRQVRNLKRQMLNEGETGIIHKNRYYKPVNTYETDIRKELARIYRAEFRGTNFTEFARIMQARGYELSRSTIYNILRENRIRSPQRKKVKRKKKTTKTQTQNINKEKVIQK